jgi:hypothetical protein
MEVDVRKCKYEQEKMEESNRIEEKEQETKTIEMALLKR